MSYVLSYSNRGVLFSGLFQGVSVQIFVVSSLLRDVSALYKEPQVVEIIWLEIFTMASLIA